MALATANSMGMNTTTYDPESLMNKNKTLILDFTSDILKQYIRSLLNLIDHPELINLMNQDLSIED